MYKNAKIYRLLFCIIPLFLGRHLLLQAQVDTTVTILLRGEKIDKSVKIFLNDVQLNQVNWLGSDMVKVDIPFYLVKQLIGTGDSLKRYIYASIKARNPASSKPPSLTNLIFAHIPPDTLSAKLIGKWNKKSVPLLISNDLPPEVQEEVRKAIQAYNNIGFDLVIETDTTSAKPSLALRNNPFRDSLNVIGFLSEAESPTNVNPPGWTIPHPPQLKNQSPQNRIFIEVDIAINREMYERSGLLKIGLIPSNEQGRVSNLTWVIAHEIGHFLGLADIFITLGEKPDGSIIKYTWENSIMPHGTAPARWLETIPDREKKLLKTLYGTKKLLTIFR